MKHENYVSPYADSPDYWWGHHNGMLIKDHLPLIYGKVADIGCNHGALSRKVAELESVRMVTGYDISEAALTVARQYPNPLITYRHLDFRMTKPIGYNNFMYAFHFLEHIERLWLRQTIDNMLNCIYPGGHLLVSVPYKDAYPSEYHESEFDERDLEMLLGAKAWRDERTDAHGNKHNCVVSLVKI